MKHTRTRGTVLQAKDIDTDTMLRRLATTQGLWQTRWEADFMDALLPGPWRDDDVRDKLIIAKAARLCRSGLVSGCAPCMCRGDYEITDKGLARIGVARTRRMIG